MPITNVRPGSAAAKVTPRVVSSRAPAPASPQPTAPVLSSSAKPAAVAPAPSPTPHAQTNGSAHVSSPPPNAPPTASTTTPTQHQQRQVSSQHLHQQQQHGASPGQHSPGSRFSSKPRSTPAGGTATTGSVLYVNGLASSPVRGGGSSSVFRSTTSTGDAHIKALASQVNDVSIRDSVSFGARRGPAASASFSSTSPSSRDAHCQLLLKSTYANPRSPSPSGSQGGSAKPLPSASFRSRSPTACAHVNAVPKPLGVGYELRGMGPQGSMAALPSASYRSGTSVGDAHIKALPRSLSDNNLPLDDPLRGGATGCTAAFRSTTSIGDAHIKALPKPTDVCVAFRAVPLKGDSSASLLSASASQLRL